MHIAFRTDASHDIGHGHVMRCLTLASALSAQGATCHFICRPHAGHLIDKIRNMGFPVTELPPPGAMGCEASEDTPGLGAATAADAEQTLSALPAGIDWLVVDHYAIDAHWERHLRKACHRLMVIDDLANRQHECDLLLDPNAGRSAADYARFVPEYCSVLAGPSFALLRSEFAAARRRSLVRPRDSLRKLLVSMGGVDRNNVTTRVLQMLDSHPFSCAPDITVVLGRNAPWRDSVQHTAGRMRWPTRVIVDCTNMATLMADADLAIGAAGGSALERCCVGLPSVVIPIASNQTAGAKALEASGAITIASLDGKGERSLSAVLSSLQSRNALQRASAAAAQLTQGQGADELAMRMVRPHGVRLRTMEEADLERVLGWRNAPSIRRWMRNSGRITSDEHAAWFRRCSKDPQRQLMIAETGQAPFGFVQFSILGDEHGAEWGFYVAPDAPPGSGTLLGNLALEHAFRKLRLPRLLGRALPDNAASIRFHQKLGFRPSATPAAAHESVAALQTFELLKKDWESLQGATK